MKKIKEVNNLKETKKAEKEVQKAEKTKAKEEKKALKQDTITSKIQKLLFNRKKNIQEYSSLIERGLETNIKGSLKVISKGKRHYYYFQHFDPMKGKYVYSYLNREKLEVAKKIALHDYCSDINKLIIREKRFLDEFLSYDFERAIDECYSKLSEGRKALLSPLPGTVQYKLNIWENEKYEINTAYPESLTHETERGEMVRSKSEEIIANFLYSLRDQLDYKYERPLELKIKGKKQIIYPDFTIFNYKTGEIFIIEHVSRLDWPNYHDSFVWKYKAYVENGMIQNGTVIYSFESENEPFTLKQIKKLVEDIILQ